MVAGFVGQTAPLVTKRFDEADGGMLFIDEAYTLARGGENDFGREAIDAIVKLMEDRREDLAVVVAGYPDEMADFLDANPGLRSRASRRTIVFPDYSTDELVAIFGSIGEKNRYELDEAGDGRAAEGDRGDAADQGVRQRALRPQPVRGGDRATGEPAGCDQADRQTDAELVTLSAADVASAAERLAMKRSAARVCVLAAGLVGRRGVHPPTPIDDDQATLVERDRSGGVPDRSCARPRSRAACERLDADGVVRRRADRGGRRRPPIGSPRTASSAPTPGWPPRSGPRSPPMPSRAPSSIAGDLAARARCSRAAEW